MKAELVRSETGVRARQTEGEKEKASRGGKGKLR